MATWRPAPSVRRGLEEANERWPRRNRASDGILGDASHATMNSDHNPDARGVVHAFDLTHDPSGGPDCSQLAEHLRSVHDRRVRYVIWNGRLFRGPWSDSVLAGRARPWIWERYTGENPHRTHMHVSVGYSASAENDVSPWWDLEDEMALDAADIRAAVRQVLNEGTGAGQTSWAGTSKATLSGVQSLSNKLAEARGTILAAVNALAVTPPAGAVTAVPLDPDQAVALTGSVMAAVERGLATALADVQVGLAPTDRDAIVREVGGSVLAAIAQAGQAESLAVEAGDEPEA